MRVLITGSSGRVGGAIAARLSRRHECIGLDRRPGRWTNVRGEIGDAALLDKVMTQVKGVVHTAALHAPHVESCSERQFVEINVHATERLLAVARRKNVARFVYTSTTSLYGDALVPKDRAVWVSEALRPEPRDIYDETKIAAEQACRAASDSNFRCVSLRMSRCFEEPARLMALYRLYRGVDLRDVADAHALALAVDVEPFDVFNISAASPFGENDLHELWRDAASVIARYHPQVRPLFERRGWRLPRQIDRVYVIDKARKMLGYKPTHNFAEQLAASPEAP